MLRVLPCALLVALLPLAGRAQAPDASAPVAAEPDAEAIVAEARAQLAALTGALEAGADLHPPGEEEAATGLPPTSLTSALPPATPTRVDAPVELDWLQGITPPDLTFRWDERLLNFLEHYRGAPRGQQHIRAWMQRAGRYAPMIRQQLRKAGLPQDLLYVAMVESGFDPAVRSPAGAVGMWQFTAATAKDYGLEVNRWVDERMSPERSTEAAVRFFADLHRRLGSWPLALAAYNMGYGALTRAIRKYNTNDLWVLAQLEAGLPYETVSYVAKVTACAVIGRNPERFGLGDLTPDDPASTVRLPLPGGTSLQRVARAAGMRLEALATRNPELRKGRLPPDVREFPVRVPADRVERLQKRFPSAAQARVSHRRHVMRFGERLSDVAALYGTDTDKLRALNGIEDEPRPLTTVLVPDVAPAESEREVAVVAVPDRRFSYTDRSRVFHRVADDDTLEEIAQFFQVSVDELCTWNNVARDAALQTGMYLQLFVPRKLDLARTLVLTPDEAKVLVVGSEAFFDFHESQRGRVRVRYRVKPGETLKQLAKRFELSVGSIARINRFSPYGEVEADQEIIVYVPQELAAKVTRHRR